MTDVLSVVADQMSDEDLSLDELGSRIVGMAGRLAAATCRWLLLVAQFDAREGYRAFGLWSTARWLSHHCGIAHRTAVEQLRVARALARFPQLADQMHTGRLSYSQVRAISRVPHDEGEAPVVDDLIELAQHSTSAQLETVVRGMRSVEPDRDGEPQEYVRSAWTPDGLRSVSARLEPERGAVVDHALHQLAAAEGLTLVDALTRMAEITLVALADAGRTPRNLRGDEHAAVVVHVTVEPEPAANLDPARATELPRSAERTPVRSDEHSTRPDGGVARPVAGHIEGGPGLPWPVVERLLCAGRVRPVVQDRAGTVLDVGRSSRAVTRRQFRALRLRDRHCTHPGCASTKGIQAHHIRHWIHGGTTDLANLTLLCEAHHHALHDGEFMIIAEEAATQRDGPRLRFVRADGRVLQAVPDPAAMITDHRPITDGFRTVADAPTTRWNGDHLDRQWAIAVLTQRRDAATRRRPDAA